ncbi:inorganic pyrophosphatase, partial [Baffinella frigidus]
VLKMSPPPKQTGSFPSEEYRLFFEKDGKTISPWHDVDTWADKSKNIVNAIIEISKNTRPKMEVATKEATNPIKQDMKKGKLRDYPLDIFWNYGMIPKTWENPNHSHPELKAFGDNDPVDVVEIGSASIPRGAIVQIKALGVLAMIDEGELDWKVLPLPISYGNRSQLSHFFAVLKFYLRGGLCAMVGLCRG